MATFISVIIYFVLHLADAFTKSGWLWGVDAWSYFGIPAAIALFVISIVLTQKKAIEKSGKLYLKFEPKLEKLPLAAIAILAGGVFYLLRQKTFFLGDGYLRLRVTKDLVMFSSGSPIGNLMPTTFYKFFHANFGAAPLLIWQWTNIIAGVIAIYFAGLYIKKLFPAKSKAILIGLAIFLTGLVQMFFGYVESYSYFATFILLHFLGLILMLRTGKISVLPMLTFFLAFGFTPTAVVFAPATALAYYFALKKNGFSPDSKKKIVYAGGTIIGLFLIMIIGFWIGGYSPGNFWGGMTKVSHILPIIGTDKVIGILSLGHLADILNQILLVAPAVIAIPLVVKNFKWNYENYVLGAAIAMALLFLLLFKSDLGNSRDWDLFSLVTFPITLFILFNIKAENGSLKPLILIVLVSLIHTGSWVAVNASENLSLDRIKVLAETPYWHNHEKSVTFDGIRQYYFDKVKNMSVKEYLSNEELAEYQTNLRYSLQYAQAANFYEENERYIYTMGLIHYQLGRFDSASFYLKQLAESNYKNRGLALALLVKSEAQQGNYPSAASYLEEITMMYPNEAQNFSDLGTLYFNMKYDSAAYATFKKADSLNPDDENTLYYLAELTSRMGKTDDAIGYLQRITVINPKNALVYNNLAAYYLAAGNRDSTQKYISLAKQNGLNQNLMDQLLDKYKLTFGR